MKKTPGGFPTKPIEQILLSDILIQAPDRWILIATRNRVGLSCASFFHPLLLNEHFTSKVIGNAFEIGNRAIGLLKTDLAVINRWKISDLAPSSP